MVRGEFNLHTEHPGPVLHATRGGDYLLWLRNTLLYSRARARSAPPLISSAAGYGFAKYEFRGQASALFWFVLGSVMVPTTALAIPTYLLFAEIGLTNNPLSDHPARRLVSPFGIYLMRIYAEGAVPSELIEAARIDGAGEFRIFLQIAFRLLAPGFVTVHALHVRGDLEQLLPAARSCSPSRSGTRSRSGSGSSEATALLLCGSLVAIVPMILAFVLLQRYWQSGLATGGVKQ